MHDNSKSHLLSDSHAGLPHVSAAIMTEHNDEDADDVIKREEKQEKLERARCAADGVASFRTMNRQ